MHMVWKCQQQENGIKMVVCVTHWEYSLQGLPECQAKEWGAGSQPAWEPGLSADVKRLGWAGLGWGFLLSPGLSGTTRNWAVKRGSKVWLALRILLYLIKSQPEESLVQNQLSSQSQ